MDAKLDRLVELGTTIARQRQAQGLSARETAERSGISPAYLRAIERGENPKTGRPSRPSADALISLAAVLDLDVVALLDFADYSAALANRSPSQADSGLANRSPDELARRIQESVRTFYRVTPFLQEVAQERLSRFAGEINLIANGTFRCSADEEPYFSQLAIERTQYNLKAVSFQDLAWWLGDFGDEYFKAHKALAEKGADITRVFVAPRETWGEYIETFKRHLTLEIHTFVIDADPATDPTVRDFVIYDDALLRSASTVLADETSSKNAEFTDRAAQIADATLDFERLRKRAIDVSVWLKSQEPETGDHD